MTENRYFRHRLAWDTLERLMFAGDQTILAQDSPIAKNESDRYFAFGQECWRFHGSIVWQSVRATSSDPFIDKAKSMAAGQKKPAPGTTGSTERQIVCTNRRARHEFDILDEIDCGIMLNGSEVKSIRNNKISIEEAYARVDDHEVWLVDCDIAEYAQASIYNHARTRKRKLLLKRRGIRKFAEGADNDGLTLIPLQVFFQRGLVKIRLGLCKGRKVHDKRQKLREQDDRREMRDARTVRR